MAFINLGNLLDTGWLKEKTALCLYLCLSTYAAEQWQEMLGSDVKLSQFHKFYLFSNQGIMNLDSVKKMLLCVILIFVLFCSILLEQR
jgi:hypothetical protein